MKNNISIKKIVLLMLVINIFSKGFGFIREVLLASFYGTTPITDAYYISVSVPLILMGFVKSFSFVYTPIFIESYQNNKKAHANTFTRKIMEIIVGISLAIIFISELFMPQIIHVFAPGYEGITFNYTIMFSRITIFLGLMSAMIELLSANLKCKNHFISQAVAGLVLSPIECMMIFLGNVFNNWLLILGPVIGELIQLIIILICYYKYNHQDIKTYNTRVSVKKELKESFVLIIPIFISSMILQLNTFFDSMFGSMLESGSVTSLNYAGKIYSMLFVLIFSTISTTLFPMLSQLVVEGNKEKLKDRFSKIISFIVIIAVPITIYSIFLSTEIVEIIYERGSFTEDMTKITATTFAAYMVGITALGIQEISNKLFYSLKKTNFSLIISGTTVFFNLINNTIFIKLWGQAGLAFASSLSIIITIPVIYFLLKKSIGKIPLEKILKNILKSIASCFVGLIIAYMLWDVVNVTNAYIRATMTFCIAIPTYFIGMYFMKSYEIMESIDLLFRRIRKR